MYAFRTGNTYRGIKDAEKAGKELEKVRKRNEGQLRPGDVVNAARPETSALHPAFEWDDAVAAEEYRKWEARQLVKQVVVIRETGEKAPAFVHVTIGDAGDRQRYYQSSETIVENVDEYQAALAMAMRKLKEAARSLEEIKRLSAEREDRTALLAVAMQALSTVQETVQRLQ